MIGFGISGTGWMADQMAQAIRRSGEARIVYVASASDARARERGAEWGAAAHGDFTAMLDDPSVDAIYVAGHNMTHAAQSIAALDRGKAVLCEKPFATSLSDSAAVIAAAKRNRALFMEAVAPPFLPAFISAAQRARAQGGIWRVKASFGYATSRAEHPGLFGPCGGVLADRAVYPLMLATILLGPVRSSDRAVDRDGDGVDIAARFAIEHEGGGRSDVAVSMVEQLANCLTIETAQGVVQLAPPLLTARRLAVGHRERAFSQHPVARRIADFGARLAGGWHGYGASPYLPELNHFCALLRDGRGESPVISFDRMIEVARLVEAARTA